MHLHPGVAFQPGPDVGVHAGGVVVHNQVRILAGAGADDLAQEGQELLVAVPGLARGSELPGGDLQRREQGTGAVPHIVMGAALGQAGLQRQDGRRPVPRRSFVRLAWRRLARCPAGWCPCCPPTGGPCAASLRSAPRVGS